MAGHSKWANIKHRKMAQDKKRSILFSKLLRNIVIAVKKDGPNPVANYALKVAIQNARSFNVPKDTIQRVIDKAVAEKGENVEDIFYEGYAPHGIGLIIHVQTTNTQRTIPMLRHILSKYGGTLASSGSTSHLFELKTVISMAPLPPSINKEEFILECVDKGAEDVVEEEDILVLYAKEDKLYELHDFLVAKGIEIKKSGREFVPKTTIQLPPPQAQSVLKLISALEDIEDVEEVYHNLEITSEIASLIE